MSETPDTTNEDLVAEEHCVDAEHPDEVNLPDDEDFDADTTGDVIGEDLDAEDLDALVDGVDPEDVDTDNAETEV